LLRGEPGEALLVLRLRSGEEGHSYKNSIVPETLLEGLNNWLLMLLLNDARGRREDTEGHLTLLRLGGLAQLKKCTKKFWPLTLYKKE
jgi:hypothetical protein